MRAIKKQKYLHITPPFSKWPWALLVRAIPTKDNDKSEPIKQHYCSRKQATCNPTTFYYSLIEPHNLLSFTQGQCVGRKKLKEQVAAPAAERSQFPSTPALVVRHWNPAVLTALGTAQAQQAAAAVIHREARVRLTGPARALAPLHTLPWSRSGGWLTLLQGSTQMLFQRHRLGCCQLQNLPHAAPLKQ